MDEMSVAQRELMLLTMHLRIAERISPLHGVVIASALNTAHARGREEGLEDAAQVAEKYGIGEGIAYKNLPRACEDIAAAIRSLKDTGPNA